MVILKLNVEVIIRRLLPSGVAAQGQAPDAWSCVCMGRGRLWVHSGELWMVETGMIPGSARKMLASGIHVTMS
eukprot:281664-Pelagomonas_calceolata.AAC.1